VDSSLDDREELAKIEGHQILDRLSRTVFYKETGRVVQSKGVLFEGILSGAAIGSVVSLTKRNAEECLAEVVGFNDNRVLLMPVSDGRGISTSSKITLVSQESSILVGESLLGRILDGNGLPMDGSKLPTDMEERSIYREPPIALERGLIRKPISMGVRAIDGFITCGKGQRIGIMAGSGVGKSILLGMIARNSKADINVIALVGERGRELREFIERDLGEEGLKRSVIVCTTSDKSALLRMRCAYVATTIAEYFRDLGKDVVLMMDSVTRFAMAQREIGLSSGEPPSTKGYTPSVFSALPRLLERAGPANKGSITGIYTVLVDGDDLEDPIADSVRSIIDGHIVLSRALAEKNHFPAIDVLKSISRVMQDVISAEHRQFSSQLRDLLASYREAEDLINVGAYVKGSNSKIDLAIEVVPKLEQFLKQNMGEDTDISDSVSGMMQIIRSAQHSETDDDGE